MPVCTLINCSYISGNEAEYSTIVWNVRVPSRLEGSVWPPCCRGLLSVSYSQWNSRYHILFSYLVKGHTCSFSPGFSERTNFYQMHLRCPPACFSFSFPELCLERRKQMNVLHVQRPSWQRDIKAVQPLGELHPYGQIYQSAVLNK